MHFSNLPTTLAVLIVSLPLTSAHFLLNYPASLGFSSTDEGSSPCGGKSYSNSTTTDFHVEGDAIAYQLLHAQANLIHRGTLDSNLNSGWTTLWPVYTQYGLGAFCQPNVISPSDWVGKTGTIQIAEDAEDGVVYQCAVVNFVSGKLDSSPSSCKNASGVSASFASDDELPADSGSGSSSNSASSSATSTSSSTSSTPTDNGAARATSQWVETAFVAVVALFWAF